MKNNFLNPHLHSILQMAQKFRKYKYLVKLCRYSADLLIAFIEQPKMNLLLGLVNQYIDIKGGLMSLPFVSE